MQRDLCVRNPRFSDRGFVICVWCSSERTKMGDEACGNMLFCFAYEKNSLCNQYCMCCITKGGVGQMMMAEIPSGMTVMVPGLPSSCSARVMASRRSVAGCIFMAFTSSGSHSETSTT